MDSFFVNLTVSSDTLCGTGRVGIRVVLPPPSPKPSANFGYNATCNNLTVTFTDSSLLNNNPGLIYQYAFKPALASATVYTNFSNLPNNNFTFAAFDSFDVRLIVSGTQICAAADTIVKRVLFKDRPVASFTANNGCTAQTISITNNSNTGNNDTLNYLWTNNDGQSSTDTAPVDFMFTTSGTKTITLKVTAQNGCADSSTKSIAVYNSPTAQFDITGACLGKNISIANTSTGAITSYAWQTSNAQQSSSMVPQFIFNTAGDYVIRLQVATANNCSTSISKNISIQAVQLITTPSIDINAIVGQPVQLSVSGASSYTWQPTANLNNTSSSNPVFKSTIAGIYPIVVEGITAVGCKGNATLTIKVFAAGKYLFIPNAFTPNGDGVNDRFSITCSGLQELTSFTIFNRYAQAVYQQNTCGIKGWDGTFGGSSQPIGAYVYYWQGVTYSGKLVKGYGSILLAR